MLWVPKGLAHGILVTSEQVDFLYKCTDLYSPAHEKTLAWDDPAWESAGRCLPGCSRNSRQRMPKVTSFKDIEKFP